MAPHSRASEKRWPWRLLTQQLGHGAFSKLLWSTPRIRDEASVMRGFRVDKEQYILRRSYEAKAILHIGCTGAPNTAVRWREGTLLHKNLCDNLVAGQQLVGVDIDEPSLTWLQERMPHQELLLADAHHLSDCFGPDMRFDLVLAGDVIEHLANPGLFLESARMVLDAGGRILITTANAFGVAGFAKALLDHEPVHPEHTAYFSRSTLGRLCELCGLRMVRFGYYRCESMTSFSLNTLVSNTLENTLASVWPQFSTGVIAEVMDSS
jgi:2-polyprenyl-3-methyl-5-hydroxy-6-metoxy-1,4-benzoquinol methylase